MLAGQVYRRGRDLAHRQAGQGDDHGQAGRHHRRPGCSHGHRRGLRYGAAGLQLLPEPGDDEQRVVDADGQAQHHRQHRGGRLQIHETGQGRDAQRADADADHRGQQVHPGGDQRTVGDGQHEQRDDDTDHLGRAADLDLLLGGFAADLDGQPPGPGPGRGPAPVFALRVGEFWPGGHGVGDGAVRGALVGGNTAGAAGSRGLVAAATPGSFASSPAIRVTAAADAGSVILPAPGPCTTTCAVPPAEAAPNRSPIRSRAVVDSWPGILKLFTVLPDSVSAPTPAARKTTNQTTVTVIRCRTDARPSRCSKRARNRPSLML